MRGAENNPYPVNTDIISVLLDTIATTSQTLDYVDDAQESGISDWLPDLVPVVEVLRMEAYTLIGDCNDFIHQIGGIPVRTSLEPDATITGFTGFSEGIWTFKCKSSRNGEEVMKGSAQRLREVYSATLPREPSEQPEL